jgi:diguanylate cyclase (GGDEF)-like protein
MSKRILVVEDDFDISNMLRIYFSGQGYDVQVAPRGGDALVATRQQLPHLIVLDIMLPDMDGYAVCRELRTTTRTSHVPIIFLTQRDERSDKIAGLELGADDYITKPFDIEELKLRVQNAISRSERETLTDPRSGLPSSRLIEDQLRSLMRQTQMWSYLDLKLNFFDAFRDVYGFVAGDEVLRFTALLIGEVVDEYGTPDDFIGHPGGDNFVVITFSERYEELRTALIERFNEDVQTHYSFIDRERGYVLVDDGEGGERQAPLMTLSVGIVNSDVNRVADIREITELAAEDRRLQLSGVEADDSWETEW